ncbi:MAG: pitrilysin family protein [Longimicrobiales bacterium]|nr:pitrilysin family protein [Longimicrobiales bacterium]
MSLGLELHRRRLDNGLDVVVAPDVSTPIVAVNLWYGVGSRNERPGRTGFAHLFEHMMFQGSKHVSKNGHFEFIERAGGSLNGSTWFDRTNYFETLPSNQLDLALWLEADRMGWLVDAISREKFDNQRDVVKNEKRERYDNQPYGDWLERMQRLVWPEGHPYRHTVIGSMDDLDAADLDDVVDFFRTWYVPNNAVLTVAGDVEVDDAFRRVERWFGPIPAGADPPGIAGSAEVPVPMAESRREVVEEDVPLPRVFLGLRIPPFTDPAFDAVEVAAGVLGAGRAARLHARLVRTGVVRDAFVYPFPLATGASLLLVGATGFERSDPARIEAALVDELERLPDLTEAEVERALALEEARLAREMERLETRADRISMYTQLFDRPERINETLERLRALSIDEVREAARAWFAAPHRATLTWVPRAPTERTATPAPAESGAPA